MKLASVFAFFLFSLLGMAQTNQKALDDFATRIGG
jgi:hypothetical protein